MCRNCVLSFRLGFVTDSMPNIKHYKFSSCREEEIKLYITTIPLALTIGPSNCVNTASYPTIAELVWGTPCL